MISVQNLQQQLSGSKRAILFVLLAISLQSCGVLDGIFGSKPTPPPPPPPPIEEEVDVIEEEEPVVIVEEEVIEPKDTIIIPEPPVIEKEQMDVAIILPFQLDKMDATNSFPDTSRNSIELYKGIQFALSKAYFSDKELNVYVFDNAGDDATTLSILNKHPFPDVDVVIGPLYTKSLKLVSDYAKQNEILFISPLSSSASLASNNPYIVSSLATTQTRYEILLDYINDSFINPNVGVFYQPVSKEERVRRDIQIAASGKGMTIKEQISEGRDMFSAVETLLETGRENVIITGVDDNEEGRLYFDQLLNFLNQLGTQYNIKVIAVREWNDVKQIAPQRYPNVSLYILDRFLDTTNSPKSAEFASVQAMNNNQPVHIYTLQGYDLMNYLLELMEIHGEDFAQYIKTSQYTGLQTKYQFDEFNQSNGLQFFENKRINILQYQNGGWQLKN